MSKASCAVINVKMVNVKLGRTVVSNCILLKIQIARLLLILKKKRGALETRMEPFSLPEPPFLLITWSVKQNRSLACSIQA